MFKKTFSYAMKFYFWEVIEPVKIPESWSPSIQDDGFIDVWKPVSGKNGLYAHQTYDPYEERFLTTEEYWRRSERKIKEKYGKLMLLPVRENEYEEFLAWKLEKGD